MEVLENPHAFVKHFTIYHQGEEEEVQYGMEVVGRIHPTDLVMNNKMEYHLPAVARVTYSNTVGRGGGRRGNRDSLRTTRRPMDP